LAIKGIGTFKGSKGCNEDVKRNKSKDSFKSVKDSKAIVVKSSSKSLFARAIKYWVAGRSEPDNRIN
jgi:hypothetical protein